MHVTFKASLIGLMGGAALIVPQMISFPTTAHGEQRPTSQVRITTQDAHRQIKSNGLPDHTPGTFPRRGNPNTIQPQSYVFSVPIQPKANVSPTPVRLSPFGIALNGVLFDPGAAEFWNNDRHSGWQYEAMSGKIDLGLDEHHAHVQRTGAYHYHGMPTGHVHLQGGSDKTMTLIGYAADGFPIYAGYGFSNPMKADSPMRIMRPSYQLKKGTRPDGPGGAYDGRFVEDYEYVAGSGDLDDCNGRFGVTPESPEGIYHYFVTESFPFISRHFRGTPDPTFIRQPREGPPKPTRPRPSSTATSRPKALTAFIWRSSWLHVPRA